MPDGHDEWEFVNKETTYNRIMDRYYNEHPTYNGEGVDEAKSFERMVKNMIYGSEEYRFNGGE